MPFQEFLNNYQHINENFNFTKHKLSQIREELTSGLIESAYAEKICIIVTGSYGRFEASGESDIDLFWFINADIPDQPEEILKDEIETIRKVITKHIPKETGSTGTFGPLAVVRQTELVGNIGGKNDSNENMTRRMLLLLEGTYLYNKDQFDEIRKNLIDKYIKVDQNSNQIPRFLLNDIIRYYRTIATDFEFKVSEDSKEWGLRNIKLKFSRKFLYFGGLIAVAELMNVSEIDEQKLRLNAIFNQTVFERLYRSADKNPLSSEINKIFSLYNNFLKQISDQNNRVVLESITKAERNSNDLYKQLRNDGLKFSQEMEKFIRDFYGDKFISFLIF